jgi:predicted DsbA family dithiol-disulfide isomerase
MGEQERSVRPQIAPGAPAEASPSAPSRWADLLVVGLALAALLVSGLVVRREFFPVDRPLPERARPPLVSAQERPEVERLARMGWRTGAPVSARAATIVEFADFQCPSCQGLAADLDTLIRADPAHIALVYHHFPLERIHPHAFDAAVAAECAGAQGRFDAMRIVLFESQAEIGEVPWSVLARRAKVPDGFGFERCLRGDEAPSAVRADRAAATRLGLYATPTLLVGGHVVSGRVGRDSLLHLIREATPH